MFQVATDVNVTCDGHSETGNRHTPLLINVMYFNLDALLVWHVYNHLLKGLWQATLYKNVKAVLKSDEIT